VRLIHQHISDFLLMAFSHNASAVSPLSTGMVLLLNLVIGLGHFLVLLNTGAYLPMIPHVAGSLGVNPDFAIWTQSDFFSPWPWPFPPLPGFCSAGGGGECGFWQVLLSYSPWLQSSVPNQMIMTSF